MKKINELVVEQLNTQELCAVRGGFDDSDQEWDEGEGAACVNYMCKRKACKRKAVKQEA